MSADPPPIVVEVTVDLPVPVDIIARLLELADDIGTVTALDGADDTFRMTVECWSNQ